MCSIIEEERNISNNENDGGLKERATLSEQFVLLIRRVCNLLAYQRR